MGTIVIKEGCYKTVMSEKYGVIMVNISVCHPGDVEYEHLSAYKITREEAEKRVLKAKKNGAEVKIEK